MSAIAEHHRRESAMSSPSKRVSNSPDSRRPKLAHQKFTSVPAWMKVEFPIYDVAVLQKAFVAG